MCWHYDHVSGRNVLRNSVFSGKNQSVSQGFFRSTIVAIAMAFAALALEAQTNSDNSQFSLTISALRPSYKVGASVKLKIVMTNTSNREIDTEAVYDRSIDAS
jgi:hypothetical protein